MILCSTCNAEAPSHYPYCPLCGARRPAQAGRPAGAHIVVLLDRTGSMNPIREATIGAFNMFLAEQQSDATDCRFTLTLFAGDVADMPNGSITLHEAAPIDRVPPLTTKTYRPDGNTPLYDAIARSIDAAEFVQARDRRRVLFVIHTDGHENASTTWTKDTIRALIQRKQREGWSFLYVGAEFSTYADAADIGIMAEDTSQYDHTADGVSQSMRTVAQRSTRHRRGSNPTPSTPVTPV